MTNTLRFSQHALDRMAERYITTREVRFVLSNPNRVAAPQWRKGPQRWLKRDFLKNGHECKVVYIEEHGWTTVITVMWVYEEDSK